MYAFGFDLLRRAEANVVKEGEKNAINPQNKANGCGILFNFYSICYLGTGHTLLNLFYFSFWSCTDLQKVLIIISTHVMYNMLSRPLMLWPVYYRGPLNVTLFL